MKRLCVERYDQEYYRGPMSGVEQAVFKRIDAIHNPVQALFGLFLLIIGFLAFNPGSTLSTTDSNDLLAGRATVTTLFAASGGGLASFAIGLCRYRSLTVNIPDFTIATIAGMVAICAGCHAIPASLALLVGFVGGVLAGLTQEICIWRQLDDVVGAVAAHGPPGVWGVICVPLFSKPHCQSDLKGLVFGGGAAAWELLRVQTIGVLAITGFTMASSYVAILLIDTLVGFRSKRVTELIGHDYVEHAFSDSGSLKVDRNVFDHLRVHSPIRTSVLERLQKAASPTKQYTASPPPDLPPDGEDAAALIAALRKEVNSLKEDMTSLRRSFPDQKTKDASDTGSEESKYSSDIGCEGDTHDI